MVTGSGYARSLSDNAIAWWTQAQQTGRLADVDQAIGLGRQAIAASGPGEPDYVTFVANVGTYHLTRFGLSGEGTDLDQAIAHLGPGAGVPGPNQVLFRTNLGAASLLRFQLTGQVADLDQAVAQLASVADVPGPNQVTARTNLGAALHHRFELHGRMPDLDAAIAQLGLAMAAAPEYGPAAGNHGTACWSRFERTGDPADLEGAIGSLRKAVTVGPGDPHLATFLSHLGLALQARFERTGVLADLEEAITHHDRAVVAGETQPHGFPARLSNLAWAYLARFERLGRPADLDRAIDAGRRAVAAVGDGPLTAPMINNLAISLQTRFERTGELADLDLAVELKERAVAATPDGSPGKPVWLMNLASAYTMRLERTGHPEDGDRAVEAGRRAVSAMPANHQRRGMALSNLGAALQERYDRTGDLADLEEAVAAKEQAVSVTPEGHPDRPLFLSNLTLAYQERHVRTGSAADLDRAIDAGRAALEAVPGDHADYALYLNNVASAYQSRHTRFGSQADLDLAIEYRERALAATPDDHYRRALYLSNLGSARLSRASRTKSPSDLDAAIDAGRKAVAATPADAPDRWQRLINLAAMYLERFDRTGDGADADLAVHNARQVVDSAPAGHPVHTSGLFRLGAAHLARFRATGALPDVELAIETALRAVAETPEDYPFRASRLYIVVAGYLRRFEAGGGAPDRARVDELVAQVDGVRESLPGDRVMLGWAAGRLLEALGDHETARRLLDTAVRLLPAVASRVTPFADQEDRLGGRIGLVGEAIAAHCALGDAAGALEVAEHSRGILLAAQLDSRTELDAVPPALADRFRHVRDRLNAADLGTDVVDRRRRLWAEYDALVGEIRRLPGLAGFLVPPRWQDLRPADGVVVLLNAGRRGGNAVVVPAGAEPVPVALPELTAAEVEARADELAGAIADPGAFAGELRRQRVVAELLAWLWEAAVGPVLEVVAAPRVWWLPTGGLGMLPLHAAAPADGPGALDRVISSYTPTLRALGHARGRAAAAARHHLTVAMGHTPGLPDLPATVAEARSGHAGTLLTDEQATVDRVLAALPQASWAHFACHAGTNPRTPSEGALHLHDGTLPIARISRLALPTAELAYLSACSTGQIGWRHAEESIHLASAFQLAGFRHVIASLWPLEDRTAAVAAERFYALMPATPSAGQAAVVLHQVVRELREAQPDRPHVWAPLIHGGP
ncbi:CHAT domain-containing protein [Amycolatopsis sp. Hca4]|uniref:CHAT domain-containing protein n=1 Tax=Amycolatopsis sp. Hca4 TaxID=2742131 RepID=UPI00158FE75A|nr:CHAT domain-containing protein [Amycolatopsis sp. Hca4]QKV76344.1 CHAT domain-containing protein [Amycolatopsis sp. Hca4]